MALHSCVLVLAETPLRHASATAGRSNGYDVLACTPPLEAIHMLERHGDQIGYAVLSPATPRALELRELLADEYPAIERLVLS